MCQIFIKGPDNRSQVLVITENTMPMDCFLLVDNRVCKGKMKESYENKKISFRLMYNGRFLDNKKGLLEQNVANESTLQLKINPLR